MFFVALVWCMHPKDTAVQPVAAVLLHPFVLRARGSCLLGMARWQKAGLSTVVSCLNVVHNGSIVPTPKLTSR